MIEDIAHDEAKRLETLLQLGLLDTKPEAEFDEIVHLAAAICGTPMSLITLVDERRQWFKAAVGLPGVTETPREVAFCAHAIQRPELFIVEDASADPRFADNPLVTGNPDIRFYAGMPLEAPNGYRMGTLCVIDRVPRRLDANQTQALTVLASQVRARMELRMQRNALAIALKEKERVTAGLEASERLFRSFMDYSPFISYLKDEDGRFVYYNKRFMERFSLGTESWIGTTAEELLPPESRQQFRETERVILDRHEEQVLVERSIEDGQTYHWRSHKFPCIEPTGRRLLGGVSVDVTEDIAREEELHRYQAELEAANLRLAELAVTDSLTGLANRRAFEAQLAIDFSRCSRRSCPLSVAMIDIDDFKQVNDTLGHPVGDQVLSEAGEVLRQTVRKSDMAARYGGEEFIVILNETTTEQALLWAQRLERALEVAHWSYRKISVSLGIATLTDDVSDMNRLVQMADSALYAAKRAGKGRAVVWTPNTDVPR